MKRIKGFLIGAISIFLFAGLGMAQNIATKKEGTLAVHADQGLDSLVQIHKRLNEEKQSMPGYRVQLFFGNDRKKATDIRAAFMQKHTDTPAYLLYQQPYYKVRAGNYRSRLDAYKLFTELTAEYPAAFVVKDEIALPPAE